jgi:hypothetical protein
MKHALPSVAAFIILVLGLGLSAQGATADWYTRITLGPLKLGMEEAEVIAALGPPTEKGEVVEEGATGLFLSEWAWPNQGMWVTLGAEVRGGAQSVERLQIAAPSGLKTPEGIGIGSKAEQVLAAYRSELDPETPPTEQSIVVGSLFGGMIFTLTNGVVTEVFLGAAAE